MADEQVPVETIEPVTGRGRTYMCMSMPAVNYRFVMPGAALTEDEFRRPEESAGD